MKQIICLIFLILSTLTSHAENKPPKLIVQLVVDQLRGDLINQHQQQFGAHGFNYLLNHGLNFQNAHHPHANTTTCAGHATIATGSYPSMHGIVNNDWYDRNSRQLMYCMEDIKATILPTIHTQKTIPGRSPHNMKQSTLSDELVLSGMGRAYGVSLKDRSAIALAGHSGKAFWFDKTNGGFITSKYYYQSYPLWVVNWNKQYQPLAYDWNLEHPKSYYQNASHQPFRHDYGSFGQTFPHHVLSPPSEDYFKALSRTPTADELTADFAILLLKQEQLGTKEKQTDYLGISFSAVDAIGHQFGPNSIEAEDNLLSLDKTIAKLLAAIDEQVGLDNTLIILSADHGVSDSPSYLKEHHIPEIKPVNIKNTRAFIQALLMQKYQLPKESLMKIVPPYIYLDKNIIRKHHLNLAEVSRYTASALSQIPGIFRAYPLPVTNVEKDWLSAKVDRMAYPYRAGDIYIVQPPFQSYGIKKEDRVAHGSPWQYDSYVPLLFVNAHFKPQRIARPVSTTDIAPTLSALLMIKAPSGAVGDPLKEVFKEYNQEKQSSTS